jgi:probable HAF family extracellular repeat protein
VKKNLSAPSKSLGRLSIIAILFLLVWIGFRNPAAVHSASGEAPLPGDLASALAAGKQQSPQIVKGANGYLVVWTDMRSALSFTGMNGPYEGPGLGTMIDVYAARLDANGALIDTTPIIITEASYNQFAPLVGWNGQNWLVVWTTERATNRYYYDIMAARVAPDGTVLDDPPIVLNSAPTSIDYYTSWTISSDGTNWAVAWRGIDNSGLIWTIDGSRISPEGIVLDPGGKRLRQDFWNSGSTNADLAFAGDEYMLTWIELDNVSVDWVIKAERLTPSLDVIGAPFQVNLYTPSSAGAPRIASNGDGFLIVWFEDRYYGFAQIFGSRVSHTGQVLDPNGIEITPAAGYTQFIPDVCWDGANYFVSHNKQVNEFDDDIYVTRVTSAGTVLDPNGILVKGGPGSQLQPSIAPGTTGGAEIVWADDAAVSSDPSDILAAKVSATGVVGTSNAISLGAPRQHSPRLAATNSGYLAVFVSEVSGVSRILAQRLDATGNSLDQEPLVVASGSAYLRNPSVAWNGSVFLVVWEDGSANSFRGQIFARRVLPNGVFPDGTAFPVMPGVQADVSALGDTFLVVGDDAPTNPHFRFIFAVRVSSAGSVLGSPTTIGGSYSVSPSVSALGNRWLAVWEAHATHDSPPSAIVGTFVNSDGTSSAQFGVSDGGHDTTPSLASAGSSALIVWADSDIFGRRIMQDGTLLDTATGTVFSGAANGQYLPAVAWDGAQYVVDWLDHRNYTYPDQPRGDIFGARVGVNGNLLDANGFAIASSPASEETPTVAALNGNTIFAYASFNDRAPYAAYRITLRRFPFNLDYSISASPPSDTVPQGGSTSFNVTVTPVGAFTGVVDLSVYGLPPGTTATFTPASVMGSGLATMTVMAALTTPLEIYPLTIVGASGPQQSTAQVTLVVTNTPAPARFSVTDLGTLGGLSSEAWDVNESGQVVGWAKIANGQRRAFLYSGGLMSDLGTLGGTESVAYAINDSSQVVGSAKNGAGTQRAFRYSGGALQDLGTIDGGPYASLAFGINNSGQIVGNSNWGQQSGPLAFLLTGGAMSSLGTFGGLWSDGWDINSSGQVAGTATDVSGSPRAFLYSGGVKQDLGILSQSGDSYAYALNDLGHVVGASTYTNNATNPHAFVYRAGVMQDLGTLGGTDSLARSINNSGQVVGYATNAGAASRAFLYEATMTNLNSLIQADSGWVLTEARDINNAGQIVGAGVINGQTHAFLLTPTSSPTPNTLQFTASGYSAGEGDGSALITVTRSGNTTGTSTVDFATYDDSAIQLRDYLIETGTLTFNPGETTKSFGVPIVDDVFPESSETLTLSLSNATGATLSSTNTATLMINDNDQSGPSIPQKRFFAQLNGAQETPPNASTATGSGIVLLNSTDTSALVGLKFSNLTSTEMGAHIHTGAMGTDGPVTFAMPTTNPVIDSSISPTTQQVADLKAGSQYMNVHSSIFPGGEIRGQFLWNPTLEMPFFIRQHYLDFLNREPDAGGLAFWISQIHCPQGQTGDQADLQCFHDRTVGVSNQFFFSGEFHLTASFVFKAYRAAYGNTQPFPNPDPAIPAESHKLPDYNAFMSDRPRVLGGANLAETQLSFTSLFVTRPEFASRYGVGLNTGALFVDAVLANIQAADGVVFSSTDRQTLINHYNNAGGGNAGRAMVMWHLSNDYWNTCSGAAPCVPPGFAPAVDNRAFIDAEYNREFALTLYFGYLRRNPEIGGFLYWQDAINQAPVRDQVRQRGLVCSFMTSGEYQFRFGPGTPVGNGLLFPRTNAECR